MGLRSLAVTFLSLLILGATGCQAVHEACVPGSPDQSVFKGFDVRIAPRIRMASYASSTIGTNFLDPDNLGPHGYRYNLSEKNGVVYTCKAGHIDIAHLRKIADWTAFLAARTHEQIRKNETEFTFKLQEDSLYFVELAYPENWKDLSQSEKEHIAYDISLGLGQYFAYTAGIWHEILTWFGYKCTGLYPEFQSAFSWEDTFSNLFGSHIGLLALQDTKHTFSEAVTLALDRELEKLDVQTSHTAWRAAEKVRGRWFSGDLLFVDMKKRNFDIGLADGFITPWIVPGLAECEGTEVQPYPVPNPDFLSEYGFSVKFEIEPREWEKDKILNVVYPDRQERKKRLKPAIHFARIMDYITKDAVKKYGHDVGLCYSR